MPNPLVIQSGQIGTGSTVLVSSSNAASYGGSRCTISFYNTNVATQTVALLYNQFVSGALQGALQIGQFELASGYSELVVGCPLGANDVITATTTTASAINYFVTSSTNNDQILTFAQYDGTGAPVTTQNTVTGVAQAITSTSANAFAVGPSGTTNPTFNVDASTSAAVTGIDIVGAASGAGVAVKAISSSGAENLTIDAKGTGTITLNGTATGTVTIGSSLTMTDAKNIIVGSSTGTKIGTATTQKMAFWNATPIVQPANTVDYVTSLVNLGLRASGGTASATFPGTLSAVGITTTGNLTVSAVNIVTDGTTGTQVGTATTQKLGFFGKTPVIQPVGSTDTTTSASGSGTQIFLNTLLTGAGGTAAFSLGGVITQLKLLGLLAA